MDWELEAKDMGKDDQYVCAWHTLPPTPSQVRTPVPHLWPSFTGME